MKIGQAGFGGDRGASETTGLMNNLLANTILASREINVCFFFFFLLTEHPSNWLAFPSWAWS